MRRIANGTQIAALPTPPAAIGTPGYGSNGDPGAGVQATIFDAHSFNALQEEIIRVIEAAGIAPDGANLSQLLAALRVLVPGQIFSLTSSQPVTVPAWATHCEIDGLWGGGGGGGGAGANGAGGGGAAGGFARGLISVTPGSTIAAVVGAGGAPGISGGGNGGPGGTTSFGSGISATGGTAGAGVNAGYGAGGTTPGLGVGGSMQAPGQAGQRAFSQRDPLNGDGIVYVGGQGGGAVWSGPTHPSIGASAWAGWMFGVGGSGAANNSAGGQGGPGYIIGRWLP